jgi:hypothetical protein
MFFFFWDGWSILLAPLIPYTCLYLSANILSLCYENSSPEQGSTHVTQQRLIGVAEHYLRVKIVWCPAKPRRILLTHSNKVLDHFISQLEEHSINKDHKHLSTTSKF